MSLLLLLLIPVVFFVGGVVFRWILNITSRDFDAWWSMPLYMALVVPWWFSIIGTVMALSYFALFGVPI